MDNEFKIGDHVCKKSGKPFKSSQAINSIAGFCENPYTGKPAMTFNEDDSIVEIRACRLIQTNDQR